MIGVPSHTFAQCTVSISQKMDMSLPPIFHQGKFNVSERVQDNEMNYWEEKKLLELLMLCQAVKGDNGMTGAPRSVQAPETECMARSLKTGDSPHGSIF